MPQLPSHCPKFSTEKCEISEGKRDFTEKSAVAGLKFVKAKIFTEVGARNSGISVKSSNYSKFSTEKRENSEGKRDFTEKSAVAALKFVKVEIVTERGA